jgi:formylglycine-generating enzyme required for sulfatase activity
MKAIGSRVWGREWNRKRNPWVAFWLAACLAFACHGWQVAHAETQTIVDPTIAPQPAAESTGKSAAPPQSDAAIKRERARALAEQRKREKAEARAAAAEKEAERLRAAEQARQQAQTEKAEKATAAAQAAAAAKAAAASRAAKQAAAQAALQAAKQAAGKVAVKEAADRAAAARDTELRLSVARDEAAKELAARQAAERQRLADQAAKEIAAREIAAKEAREAAARASQPGRVFRDCPGCPEMVWLPRGEFDMGEAIAADGPVHRVRIDYALAAGRYEITFAEWDACVVAGGCRRRPEDAGWGRGRQPVINVSWSDTQQFVAWLSAKTGKRYRLLSEAEWEYAARAGTQTRFWWGDEAGRNHENCYNCGSRWDGHQAAPVGSFAANAFGLYDVLGNVSEWVEDCYHLSYRDAPTDGSAWTQSCANDSRDERVMRGGAWQYPAALTRSAFRTRFSNGYYDFRIGFRIARTE